MVDGTGNKVKPQTVDGSIDQIDVSDRWLRTFFVVATERSFTAAARRIGIGQSSVSHAVKQLETTLGVTLFIRADRGVRLTSHGEILRHHVGPAFDAIDHGVREVCRQQTDGVVALSVSTSFAAWWLLPRLTSFKADHPDIELRCITSDNDDRVGADDADLWIPHGANRWHQLDADRLTDERIVAVATPAVAATLDDLDDPAALLGADLLHLEERYGTRYDWKRWFDDRGLAAPTMRGARSNDYSVIVQAALDGQGVALGWSHITDQLIDQGRLVAVGGPPIVTDQPFVILRRRGVRRTAIDALRHWLIATTP